MWNAISLVLDLNSVRRVHNHYTTGMKHYEWVLFLSVKIDLSWKVNDSHLSIGRYECVLRHKKVGNFWYEVNMYTLFYVDVITFVENCQGICLTWYAMIPKQTFLTWMKSSILTNRHTLEFPSSKLSLKKFFNLFFTVIRTHGYRRWFPKLLRRQSSGGCRFNPHYRRVTIQEYLTLVPGYG